MHKFYFHFQWIGVLLLPLSILCVPEVLGINVQWIFPAFPYIFTFILFATLLSIAIITTSTSKLNNKRYLTLRITTLIESSYTALIALLLTQGTAPSSHSIIVSVLLDREMNETAAWMVNDIVRGSLYFLLALFLITALFSAIVQRLSFKHRIVSLYNISSTDDEIDNRI